MPTVKVHGAVNKELARMISPDLRTMVGMIDDAFINRPTPKAMPLDLKQFLSMLEGWGDVHGTTLGNMLRLLNSLCDVGESWPSRAMSGEKEIPNRSERKRIRVICNDMQAELRRIIVCLHEVWERPFPASPVHLRDLQAQISSLLEHRLRKFRTFFLAFIALGEMSPEDFAKKGLTTLEIAIDEGKDEATKDTVKLMDATLKKVKRELRTQRAMEGIRDMSSNEPPSLGSWLKKNRGLVFLNVFAFLFGKFVDVLYPKDRRR